MISFITFITQYLFLRIIFATTFDAATYLTLDKRIALATTTCYMAKEKYYVNK
jgi:hypothetical protein